MALSHQRAFDLVIFDLGNTLIYYEGEWSEVLPLSDAKMFDSLLASGYELDPKVFIPKFAKRMDEYYSDRATEFIEYTTTRVLTELLAESGYPNASTETVRKAIDERYTISQPYWKIGDDTHDTLKKLVELGYKLALISNASDEKDVQTLIDQHDLRRYLDFVLVSAGFGFRKPHPEIFHHALKALGAAPQRAVMVGDTLGADILGAKQVGLLSVWITRWADRPDNRAHLDTIQPDAMIKTISELPDLLENWPPPHSS